MKRLEKIFQNISEWFQENESFFQKANTYLESFGQLISALSNFTKWLSTLFAHLEQDQVFLKSRHLTPANDSMHNYIFKTFWDSFADFGPLFDLLSREILKSKLTITRESKTFQTIEKITSFMLKTDLFATFMETYSTELSYWNSKQIQRVERGEVQKILKLYKDNIQIEGDFWKRLDIKEDWQRGILSIHKCFLVSSLNQPAPISMASVLDRVKLGEFQILCKGFSQIGYLDTLEKDLILHFKAQIVKSQDIRVLFRAYVWAQVVGSHLGVGNRDVSQRIFEGLEVILDNHFPFFELYIIPFLYNEIIIPERWNSSFDPSLSSPNNFDLLDREQTAGFLNLTMDELLPLVEDTNLGNFQFWFSIKMVFLVSDNTRLFLDFYQIYFERQVRGIRK